MSTDTEFEEIAGGGSYVKWESVGDKVTGTLAEFTADGGRDFNDQPCPELSISTDDGLVRVTCSPANLRSKAANAIAQHKFQIGQAIEVEFTGTYPSDKGQPGKEFAVRVAPPKPPALDEL